MRSLTEMRAASVDLHTCARTVQESSKLPSEITHDGSLVRLALEKLHLVLVRHNLIAHKAGRISDQWRNKYLEICHESGIQRRRRNNPLGS